MWTALHRWIRTAGFRPELERLPVLPEVGGAGGTDLLSLLSETTARLQEEVEKAEALARRSAAGAPGGREADERGEREWLQHARSMLPALDALDRMIDLGEDSEDQSEAFRNWLLSVKALRTRLNRTMESIGLKAVASVGSPVDLEVHDVVAVVPAGEFPANTVVEEQLKGYLFRGILIRDAKVVVAQ